MSEAGMRRLADVPLLQELPEFAVEAPTARRVSAVMRRINPTSTTSHAQAMAASMAPKYQDMRVATTAKACSTPRRSPVNATA